MQVHASSPGVLQKLARVFKEKASEDFGRIIKGTSKTRERLGVRFENYFFFIKATSPGYALVLGSV